MGISKEEQKIFEGKWFSPGDLDLVAIKRKAHDLNTRYNATFEGDVEERALILRELIGKLGKGCYLQGPIYFHYGSHTEIGDRFFANFNLTIQDDGKVKIGDDCNFGPGVTIGTGCVIGAGSVVTHDIPDNCFAAGNPCRVIREITEKERSIL